MRRLTVLYDANCSLCRRARRWLERRAQLVPLEFVAAGSPEAVRRFPGLDPAATLRDLTVVDESGRAYVGDAAWIVCLWALRDHRAMALRLSSPALRPIARRFVHAVSSRRPTTSCGDGCAR